MYGRELELFFERRRYDVFSVLELVLLFDATADVEEAVFVEIAHVAGAEAVVLREDRFVLFFSVVILLHHVRAVDDDLAFDASGFRLLFPPVCVGSISMRTPGIAFPTDPICVSRANWRSRSGSSR